MSSEKQIKLDSELFKRLFSYATKYWLSFVFAILGNIAYASVDAGFTYLLKPALDKGFIERDVWFIKWIPIIVLVAFLFRGVASLVASYSMTRVARSVVMMIRQEIFAKFLTLPARFYDRMSSGKLLSKLLYDVEQMAVVSSDALTTFVQSFCLVVGLFVVMFVISWKLTLFYLITVPIIAFVVSLSNKRIRRITQTIQHAMGDVTEIAEECIEGYKVVRTFGAEEYESNKFNTATRNNRNRDLKVVITNSLTTSSVQFVTACALSFILYLAITPTSAMALSAGGFISMIAAMLALLKPMKNLTTINASIQRGLSGAQSVFNLLDEEDEKDTGTISMDRAKGEICYEQVLFRYKQKGDNVLKSISFKIQAGKTLALVGRSGSGKSTLVSLLPRFYEALEGEITIDDINIHNIKLRDLRQQIALVTQQVTLFNDTIAKNIAYGSEHATEEDIIAAATAGHAMEFIREFPEGIHTMVGENGVLLSGGQRQRLAIARAILKDAPILILDEATSALDTESERLIQNALDKVMTNRTTLVIAHRLSTIENADIILVLDNGEIVEQGSHQELLQKQGHYAKLHKLQFKQMDELDAVV